MGSKRKQVLNSKQNVLIFVLIFILFFSFLNTQFNFPGFQNRWLRCIKYFEEGVIYGGQPECEQPPVVFIIGSLISSISGHNIQFFSNLLIIGLHSVCLFIILKLVPTKNDEEIIVTCFLYVFLILPLFVNALASLLAAFFLMVGTYVLFNGKSNLRVLYASICYTLALLSKITVVSGIFGVLFSVIILGLSKIVMPIKKKKRWSFKLNIPPVKSLIIRILYCIIPFVAGILLVYTIYPNILIYTVHCHKY